MALTKIDDRGLKTPIDLLDNEKIRFGTGNDLVIYHDGSNSYIDNLTGNDLNIRSKSIYFATNANVGAEAAINLKQNGAVELYYDNVKKLETTANGVSLSDRLYMADSKYIYMGAGNDFYLGHNGTDNYLVSSNGSFNLHMALSELAIKANNAGSVELYYDNSKKFETTSDGATFTGSKVTFAGDDNRYIDFEGNGNNRTVTFRSRDGGADDSFAKFTANGSVELYYDNVKKFETYDSGCKVVGNFFADAIYLQDSEKLNLGNSDDLQIYHDGSHSLLKHTTTGYLRLLAGGSGVTISNEDNSEAIAQFVKNGSVELYYDNSKKFETTSSGITVTGNYATTGWIDIDSDSSRFRCGDGQDLQIYHNGQDSYIRNETNDLYITNTGDDTYIIATDDIYLKHGEEFGIKCIGDGAVELYHDNVKKAETTANGVQVQAGAADTHSILRVESSGSGRAQLQLGATGTGDAGLWLDAANGDFNGADYAGVYHSNTSDNLNIVNYAKGIEFYVRSGTLGSGGLDKSIECHVDGGVELYHNNSKVFETLGNGVRAQGGIMFGSDTADANRITDYEEGTFTPGIGTSSGSVAIRTTNDTLAYTKIGNTVHITGQLVIGTCSSQGGAMWLTGLPFTCGDGTELSKRTAVVGFGWFNGAGAGSDGKRFWESYLGEGSTSLNNIQVMHDSYVPDGNSATLLGDGTDIWFDFTYKT